MDRADNDKVVGIFQSGIDIIIQIAGDGQFFLVPEKPHGAAEVKLFLRLKGIR